ncbi:MAG: undecaprenyldiphospho-muramoylpentapeptide beta-N-acetylglucosaminyltransferase [Clostridia bacterium]|nr:undecaprenyldiphospho-muramoylpentapeptide beta-N-acetylglucosaminyltransferase [Clostridia bacterium]
MKTIVLCGGGTAGHVLPALALVPLLKRHFDNIVFMGGKYGIEKEIISRHNIEFIGVENAKLKRQLSLKNALIPFKLLKGISEAKKYLKSVMPSAVFSKGGYAALPVSIAAAMLKIPVICHESDLSMGLANKLSLPFCRALCTSFEPCAKKIKKAVYTGPPVREELFTGDSSKILKNFMQKKPVILITGGSSGAAYLNSLVRSCLDSLLSYYNIIHICGKGNLNNLRREGYLQLEFSHNMQDIFAASDYVVSRGGSNALFELMLLKKPSVIIPLPKNASRGDQLQNAEYFEKKGCIITVLQQGLDAKKFIGSIKQLADKKNVLIDNIKNSDIRCGNKKIVDVILRYAKSK